MTRRKTEKKTSAAPVVHQSVLVERPKADTVSRRRDQVEALAGIKNKIFGDSMRVVEDYLRARDINPDQLDPTQDPAYWQLMNELKDEEEVRKAYRVAKMGWLPAADCPGFVKVASNMAIGIMKANAAEKGGSKVLNVGKILISADSVPQFEERDVVE